MSCFSGLARLLLVLINIVLMLVGLAVTIVGLILRYGKTLYTPFLKVGMNELQEVINDTKLGSFTVQDIDIGQVMINISIGLILGGLVLLGLSFLGCCGACCRFEFILYVYAVIIGVCLIGESVGVGLLYGKPSLVKDEARSSLSIYKGLASDEVYSLAWNIVMIQFQCCGVDNYRDFNVSKSWNRNPVSNDASLTLETPVACCKTLPSGTSQSEFQCALQYTSATSNGDQGCFDSIWKESLGNTAIAVPVLVVLAVIQILFIVSAVSVARAEDRVSPI